MEGEVVIEVVRGWGRRMKEEKEEKEERGRGKRGRGVSMGK